MFYQPELTKTNAPMNGLPQDGGSGNNKLVVSAYHFVERTMQGLWSTWVGISLIMETQGWGNYPGGGVLKRI